MEEITIKDIRIVEYSDRAIAVYGNTKPYKEEMKKMGGHYNQRLKGGCGWVFSKKRRDLVQRRLTEIVK